MYHNKSGRKFQQEISTNSIFFFTCFSGLSIVGHIVYWCLQGETAKDLLLLIGAAVIFACGLVMFLNRKNLEMTQTGTTVKED